MHRHRMSRFRNKATEPRAHLWCTQHASTMVFTAVLRCADAEGVQPDAVERDENAQDENREGGRRVRRRPDEPAPFDGDEPPPEKPLVAQEKAAEAAPEQIRISRTKWTYLHNHVLACIKQAEDGHLESAQRIESSAQTFMGVSQHDILKWHVRQELEKCAPNSKSNARFL